MDISGISEVGVVAPKAASLATTSTPLNPVVMRVPTVSVVPPSAWPAARPLAGPSRWLGVSTVFGPQGLVMRLYSLVATLLATYICN